MQSRIPKPLADTLAAAITPGEPLSPDNAAPPLPPPLVISCASPRSASFTVPSLATRKF